MELVERFKVLISLVGFYHILIERKKLFSKSFYRFSFSEIVFEILYKYTKTWLFCLVGKLDSFLSPRPPGTTEMFENFHVQWQVSH